MKRKLLALLSATIVALAVAPAAQARSVAYRLSPGAYSAQIAPGANGIACFSTSGLLYDEYPVIDGRAWYYGTHIRASFSYSSQRFRNRTSTVTVICRAYYPF